MSKDIITAQLLRMEEAMADPAVRKSKEAMAHILDPEFREIGASAQVFSYNETLDTLAQESDFTPYKVTDFHLEILSPDIALVTYEIPARECKGVMKPGSRRSSIWALTNGEWRLKFHQGTRNPI